MKAIKTVIGLFTEHNDVEGAINDLKARGYNPKDISLIMKDTHEAKKIQEHTGAEIGAGAASGAATGAVIGGLTGLLIGVGALTIPGIGAFLIGGPLAAALGLSGAAATTASGAMTGALAGGLIGALMALGLPKEEAVHYENRIKEGAILLAVPAYAGQEREIADAMNKFNASDIKALNIATKTTMHSDEESLDARPDATAPADAPAPMKDQQFARNGHTDLDHDEDRDISHHHQAGDIANPIEVQKYLKHVDYPATKDDLVNEAEEEGADVKVIHTLRDLPKDKFSNPTDVSRAIGDIR